MDCLIDTIGIEGCSETTPLTGLYVNRYLPGITLRMLDNISSEDAATYAGMWQDVQRRAADRFERDVITEFKKKFTLKTITQDINIEKVINTSNVTAAAAEYRGFTIETNLEDEIWVNSNLQRFYIQKLLIYRSASVATTIKIFDLDTQTEVSSTSVTAGTGWTTVNFLASYDYRRLFVAYDATLVNSVELDITNLENATNEFQTWWWIPWTWGGCETCGVTIKGGKSTIAAPYTITEGTNTFGLSGAFSIRCSFENLVCNNLRMFESAWMYCLGIELMVERQYTDRLNKYTAFDKNKAADLQKLFEVNYRGGIIDGIETEGALSQAVHGIDLNESDCCLEASGKIIFPDAVL